MFTRLPNPTLSVLPFGVSVGGTLIAYGYLTKPNALVVPLGTNDFGSTKTPGLSCNYPRCRTVWLLSSPFHLG